MKKILLFVIFSMITTCMFAQNRALFLNETFDNEDWPEGWERMVWSPLPSQDANLIRIVNNNNAGGTPREVEFAYVGPNTANRYGKVLSPVLPTNVPVEVMLEFIHTTNIMWTYAGPEPTIVGVGTTRDDGATFNTIWEKSVVKDEIISKVVVSEEVESPDFGKANCRLVFYYLCADENTLSRRWQIDNIRLYVVADHDASLLAIDGITENVTQGKKDIGFTFANKGKQTITSLEASYQLEGMDKVTEVFTGLSVARDTELSLMFSKKALLQVNDYKLTVTIDKVNGVNDEEPADNTLTMDIRSYMTYGEKRLVVNHFTGSMCGPCVIPNQQMKALWENHPNEMIISKYQLPSPQPGDIYYFPDGATRRDY